MARGAAQARRKTAKKPQTGTRKQAAARRPPSVESTMFFPRLRRQAKWMFVFLAFVFAAGFVFFGVGSGSTGISDVLQNFFNGSSSSGASASSLRKKAEAHPKEAKPWHDLAVKLEADNKLDDAIVALKRYTTLRPKDQSVLEELASLYLRRASAEQQVYVAAQTRSQLLSPGAVGQPPASSPLGKALASISNPIQSSVSGIVGTQASGAYQKIIQFESDAVGTYQQ